MAAARRRRRTTTRRRSTRKGAPRRTARLAYSKRPQGRVRRVRRRRNPRGYDIKGSLWAAAAGLGVAAAANALDGVSANWATPRNTAGALLAGGAVLGLIMNKMVGQDLGKGLVAGSVALGGYKLYKAMKMTAPANTQGMGNLWQPPQLSAVQGHIQPNTYATLNAVTAEVEPGTSVNLNDVHAYY